MLSLVLGKLTDLLSFGQKFSVVSVRTTYSFIIDEFI